ncbi:podocan-like [Synchiropus splendidus]|uniref:podocan-like n=1 Tax=Synchiropus splendidus TaxID=270530 RepID=UPI00237E5CA6|nr:podocan-like [Synchiropus splendidus]
MATPLPGGSTSRSAKVTPPVTELKPIEDLLPELLLRPEHLEDPGVEKQTGHAPWTTAAPQTSETVAQPEAEEPTAAQRSNHSVGRPSSAGAEDGSQRQKVQVSRPQTDHSIQRTTEAPFPFFSDDDCPPDCSCYGRVEKNSMISRCVSHKLHAEIPTAVSDTESTITHVSSLTLNDLRFFFFRFIFFVLVPDSIPSNSRYILLMNNHIQGIQLDLLKHLSSLEFLLLSNNRLTDGAIAGRELPGQRPGRSPGLEELRLEGNQLRAVSEAAWTRCPGLLVLSLSNNSLGGGSGSLPEAVLRPLTHLRTLNLDHNRLSSVPLGLPLSLKELYLKGNLIREFRDGVFGGVSQLVLLDLSSNRLTNKGLPREALLNGTHLGSLNQEGNRLKQVPPHLPQSLKTLNLEGNLIWSVGRRSLSRLTQLELCHNRLRQVPRQLPPGLRSLALTHNQIHSVSPDAFCWGQVALSGLLQVRLEHNLSHMGRLDSRAFRCLRGPQILRFY